MASPKWFVLAIFFAFVVFGIVGIEADSLRDKNAVLKQQLAEVQCKNIDLEDKLQQSMALEDLNLKEKLPVGNYMIINGDKIDGVTAANMLEGKAFVTSFSVKDK